MKPREERRKVMVRARLRGPDGWHDACILNLSSRGLMLQTARPPGRGTYVEVRRGVHVIVGRVVWSRGHRMGLKAQDRIAVALLATMPEAAVRADPSIERRGPSRPSPKANDHGQPGQALQFATLVGAGAAGAVALQALVAHVLARPIAQLEAVLSAGAG